MKKFISAITFFFTFPIRVLKRTKIDNFVGGLIFGAIFSLLVNIATVQVQEMMQKQRILEAVENEIATNAIVANGVIEQTSKSLDEKYLPNYYTTPRKYLATVWNASEALKYSVQLNPELQGELLIYYVYTIADANEILELDYELTKERLTETGCYWDYKSMTDNEQEVCLSYFQMYLGNQADTADNVFQKSYDILQQFHPTKDRLNSPLLKLLMGKQAMVVLSGEKK